MCTLAQLIEYLGIHYYQSIVEKIDVGLTVSGGKPPGGKEIVEVQYYYNRACSIVLIYPAIVVQTSIARKFNYVTDKTMFQTASFTSCPSTASN